MKKRWMTLMLALALAAALTACGEKDLPASSGPDVSVPAAGDVSLPADGGEETAEPEDQQPEGEQSEDQQPADQQPAAPSQPESKPAEKPASTPDKKPDNGSGQSGSSNGGSSSSGGTETAQSVDLAAFYETVSAGDNFPAMAALTGDTLDALYPGLNDLKPKQCLVYTPMISAVGAEIALVETDSAGDVQTVKDIFQSRIDYQIEQGAFYPATVEAWKNSSKIVSNGTYVMLVCMNGGCDGIVSSFNALFA